MKQATPKSKIALLAAFIALNMAWILRSKAFARNKKVDVLQLMLSGLLIGISSVGIIQLLTNKHNTNR
jgi:H+/Cl- antiporter ClcA